MANALKGKSSGAYVAPFDVRLPKAGEADDEVDTVVQPDVLIVCDRRKLDERGMRGAPDWVAEVLSPTTVNHDQLTKLAIPFLKGANIIQRDVTRRSFGEPGARRGSKCDGNNRERISTSQTSRARIGLPSSGRVGRSRRRGRHRSAPGACADHPLCERQERLGFRP